MQVADKNGKVIKASLEGWKGLGVRRTILVRGTIGPRPDEAVLVINATGIYLEPEAPADPE